MSNGIDLMMTNTGAQHRHHNCRAVRVTTSSAFATSSCRAPNIVAPIRDRTPAENWRCTELTVRRFARRMPEHGHSMSCSEISKIKRETVLYVSGVV